MDNRLLERRISCPYCAEKIGVVIDLSAGAQSYIEDCQVCCRPIAISFDAADDAVSWLQVERDD